MIEDRKNLFQWIKEHKKQLIFAGISIGTLILIILGIKNRAAIKAVWDSLKGVVDHPTAKDAEEVVKCITDIPPAPTSEIVTIMASNSEMVPFEVSRHIRNLPDGWHASPEKIVDALNNKIILMDGQTWVDSYMKGSIQFDANGNPAIKTSEVHSTAPGIIALKIAEKLKRFSTSSKRE